VPLDAAVARGPARRLCSDPRPADHRKP